MTTPVEPTQWVLVGRISGLYGVRGWVKLFSHTQPREALLSYQPWFLGDQLREVRLVESRAHGKGLVGRLAEIDDRDAAAALVDSSIYVRREQLPQADPGSFYWADLIGLRVLNQDGADFGVVDSLMETGSNDVLVVQGERERLIPFVLGQAIQSVDLDAGEIRVDWDPDF